MRVAMSPGRDGSSRARSTARSLENAETTSGMTSRVARAIARRRSAFAAPIAASNASNAPARIFSTARESDASRASRDATTTKATESKASREAASRETASGTSDATNARETGRRGHDDPSGHEAKDFNVRAYAASVGRAVRETAAKGGVDVDAVDAAAREAAKTAREAARRAREATGAGRRGGAETATTGAWMSPKGLVDTAVEAVKEEYRLAMMDPGDAAEERRRAKGYDEAMYEPYDGTTAVATTEAPKPSAFGKLWGGVKSKLGISSAMDKLEGLKKTAPYSKGAELAEDIRERWETSDSPMVHRIQDFQDSLFTETEQGEAYRLIRQRDPMFNMSDFIAEVRRDIPKVLGAYLKGDVDALKETNVSKEMLERLSGQINLWKHEGQFVDPRILDLSEVELMEVRMMENEPLVVLTFSCQQINCVRDKSGAIVEGGEDDIQSVHYLWAMQLIDKKFTTADGREYTKPTWALRELVLRGMMAVAA